MGASWCAWRVGARLCCHRGWTTWARIRIDHWGEGDAWGIFRGLGPDCVVTEVGQLGPVSEQTIGVKGKLGVYLELTDNIVGVLTLEPFGSSMAITEGIDGVSGARRWPVRNLLFLGLRSLHTQGMEWR
jgi:hypothetical protein